MNTDGMTGFFIRRPALTVVVSLLLVVMGAINFMGLPVRWVPAFQPPIVAIFTLSPGGSAELVESRITTPIEAALAGVDGIDTLSSNTHQGISNIILRFASGHSLNAAIEDVRGAL